MRLAPIEVVAIGTSLGGLHALQVVLAGLPATMPPIVIVQHRSASEEDRLTSLLQLRTGLVVVEPDDKTELVAGRVYVAPSDYHMLVDGGSIALTTDGTVKHARPSIDVLFESVADAYGETAVAVVLTAASEDGVDGAIAIRRAGGLVVVQDPRTAASRVLPAAVIARSAADHVMPLEAIGGWLTRACAARALLA